MRRLAAVLAMLGMLAALLVAAGSASASSSGWSYQYGNVGGQYISAIVSSDRAPSWVVETYDIRSGGACFRSQLRFQSDGNLVNYYAHSDVGSCGPWQVWWASNTNGNYHSQLRFQTDGNIVIYRSNGSVAYATNAYHGTNYRYLAKLGYGCWAGYYAPVQGGTWTRMNTHGPGTGC